jgi:hypothetical protein
MTALFMAETRECAVGSLLYLYEVVGHETMPAHDEIEGTLRFADAALTQDKHPYTEDIEQDTMQTDAKGFALHYDSPLG